MIISISFRFIFNIDEFLSLEFVAKVLASMLAVFVLG